MADGKTAEEILEEAKIAAEKIISDAEEAAEKIIEGSKNPTIAEASTLADNIIAKADTAAKKIISDAEEKGIAVIKKLKKETKSIDGISKIRKELIEKLSVGAVSGPQLPAQIASKILATADAIIDSLKEGK